MGCAGVGKGDDRFSDERAIRLFMNTVYHRLPRALAAVLALGAFVIPPPAELSAQGGQPPKLVVAIAIDQLRGDQLERYGPAFTGGFRRLLDDGRYFTQASHAHARTSTAPGHATLTTGVYPSRHGVIANSWQQRSGMQWQYMYAVGDAASPILGFEDEAVLEGRSPRNLLREGLPDWMGAVDENARRVSISRKDRAAIPMGGRNSEHVYWLLPELAQFITSTHYQDRYPGWLRGFNEEVMPEIFGVQVWESLVSEELAHLARADSADYEFDGVHTTFPHVSKQENAADTSLVQHYVWGSDRPAADNAVMALAGVALDELELGQRDETDYLALSLSVTDRMGHQHGPFSPEVFSILINVDRLLGDFFALLDEEVGEGRWVVGLSSDHGVATMPEYARGQGNVEAERIPRDSVLQLMNPIITGALQAGGSPLVISERIAGGIEAAGVASKAYTHHDLTRGAPADSFAVLYRNSYFPGRAWDTLSRWEVDLRYGEGDYLGSRTGTNHESAYWYDRWVPMIFLGPGVAPGVSDMPVYTVDFAPTLAGLAFIPFPSDLDGRRLF
jgi:predicted AlkP superfamily pyrophosphatase or phosphodiesterase